MCIVESAAVEAARESRLTSSVVTRQASRPKSGDRRGRDTVETLRRLETKGMQYGERRQSPCRCKEALGVVKLYHQVDRGWIILRVFVVCWHVPSWAMLSHTRVHARSAPCERADPVLPASFQFSLCFRGGKTFVRARPGGHRKQWETGN